MTGDETKITGDTKIKKEILDLIFIFRKKKSTIRCKKPIS